MIRYVCDHCEHTASSTSHLRGHINKKHPGKDLPTVFTEIKADQILSEQFTTKSKLIKSCHVCLKEFTTVWSKTDHVESVHEMIRYLCDHCEHIASSKRSLRGHINKKHPGKSLPTVYTKIKADQIQKSNSTNTPEVVEHKLQPQNKTSWFAEMEGEMGASITMGPELAESKPAQHDKTALVAKSKENIDAMIEGRDSVWTCTNLGKNDKTKFHPRRHAETHLERYLHQCPECPKKFRTKSNLKMHMHNHTNKGSQTTEKNTTEDENGFPCDQCEKTSVSVNALRVHKYRNHN